MRSIRRFATLLAFTLALGIPAARAQTALPGFDLERLSLDPAARGSLTVGNGEVAPTGGYRFFGALQEESEPLILLPNGSVVGNGIPTVSPKVGAVVKNRLTLHLGFAYTVWDRLELSLRLPVVLSQTGDAITESTYAKPDSSGLGTPTVGLRYGILAQDDMKKGGEVPLSLAVAVDVLTPWGSTKALAGQKDVAFAPRLELGRRFDGWLIAAQGGALLRTKNVQVPGEKPLGNELFGAGALATTGRLRAELSGRATVDLDNKRKSLETWLGVRYAIGGVDLFALGGPGFGHHDGTPTWRALLGVAYAGEPAAARPPPPPPPPVTRPIEPVPLPPPPDPCAPGRKHLPSQCPKLDDDGDGIPNAQDRCPLIPGIAALQGCPAVDSDGDGIPDHLDRCPSIPGTAEYKGCPPPKRALFKWPKIETTESIPFLRGKRVVLAQHADAVLSDVAKVIEAHPEIKKVIIEGHTDNRGSPKANRKLSLRRAEVVRARLIEKGVAASRLVARGFGPDRPIASNRTASGRRKNTRIDFYVILPPSGAKGR